MKRTSVANNDELKKVLGDALDGYNKRKETAEHPSQLRYYLKAHFLDAARKAGFKGDEYKLLEICEKGAVDLD